MILLLPLMVSLASSPGDAAPWQPTGQNVHGNDAPAAVAELVADAIAANRFRVFTDPPFTQIALDRWQRIAQGHNPQVEGGRAWHATRQGARRGDPAAAGWSGRHVIATLGDPDHGLTGPRGPG
jgi:hypothetical protein